jgi:feruloyl-CoA synthase
MSARGAARYRHAAVGGCVDATIERRADGTSVLRSCEPLGAYPARITDRLEQWAREAPERTFVAKRARTEKGGGDWQRISYADMLARVQAVGQALVDRKLSADRPVGDPVRQRPGAHHADVRRAVGRCAARDHLVGPTRWWAQDHAKLRHIIDTLRPGLVFASHGGPYARAVNACLGADVELVLAEGEVEGRRHTRFADLLATVPREGVRAAQEKVGPDTIAKFMFTSGSTKQPKGVIVTHA